MKVAVIGCGSIASTHCDAIIGAGQSIAAFCDKDIGKAEALARRYNAEAYITDDWRKVLALRPQSVHICLPHYLHCPIAVSALNEGINVLAEKPLGIDLKGIGSLLKAERRALSKGVILGVCLQNRFLPANAQAKRFLSGKTVTAVSGKVCWYRDRAYYDSGDWRGKWATEGGGVLINQALHTLDLMQWLCGYPQFVTAVCKNTQHPYIEAEDEAVCVYEKNDLKMNFYATTCNPRKIDEPVLIEAEADGIKIKLQGAALTVNGEEQTQKSVAGAAKKDCWGVGHALLIKEFYDCVNKRIPFAVNGEEGAKSALMTLSAYASAGLRVPVPDVKSLMEGD